MFETLHIAFYEIFGETKEQHLVNTWSTFVTFKAFSRKSKLNPDYVMRYELSLKLSQENLHEMAPISMIRPSTVHDLATRTSSGSLSSHMFTSRRPYISHEPYIIATIVTLKCLLLKVKVKKEHAWRCSFLPHLQFFEQNFESVWFFVLDRVDILQRFVKQRGGINYVSPVVYPELWKISLCG